ncbi:MAG: dipeptide ABC transporter ATP-binding protein [Anaerolineales bacterium]
MTNPLPQAGLQPALQMSNPKNLLQVTGLKKHFPIIKGVFAAAQGNVRAVDDVSFTIRKGETLGLVGESGCGKTTVGRCIVRAYPVTGGQMLYRMRDESVIDLAAVPEKQLSPFRRDIRMIFQDPYSSLNPRMTIYEAVSEVLRVNQICAESEMKDRVETLLKRVGLRPEYMQRYPHAFSGGERQRIVIARALITNPRLVVCDEAVSALDVSIRAQILNLLEELQADFDLTYLFISHDLSVIRHICNRVVVMYVGKVVEVADALDLYTRPRHPYTEALLSAVPIANPRGREQRKHIHLQGEIADPSNPPKGCYFHPRCKFAQQVCREQTPELRTVDKSRQVACHFAEAIQLQGVIS